MPDSENLRAETLALFVALNLTLKEEVELFTRRLEVEVARMSRAGMSKEVIYAVLLQDAKESGRLFGAFGNSVKGHLYGGISDASIIGEMDFYDRMGVDTTEMMWMSVSKQPCPDCHARAGEVETKGAWEMLGLPGTGWSVCRSSCMCRLEPTGINAPEEVKL